jgi:predicted  nucleic acid-binding Zn-ribbon protein
LISSSAFTKCNQYKSYGRPQSIYEANKDNIAAKDVAIEELKKAVTKSESDVTAYEEGLKSMNKMLRERDEKIEFL